MNRFLEKIRGALKLVHAGDRRQEWCDGLAATLAALDLSALNRSDKEAFLASLKQAESTFRKRVIGVIQAIAEERLASLAPKIDALQQLMERAEKLGIDLSYQRVTLTVAENFSQFAKEDLASDNLEIVAQGMWNVDWLANSLPQALEEADAILRDPSRQIRVPRYVTGPVDIRRGAFWQDGNPLFFVGMGHFDHVRRDIHIFPDYGFNIAQTTIAVWSVLRGPDTVNEKPIEELLTVLDRAARANVAVDLLLQPDYWPRWANEKYPELAKEKIYFNYHLDHPQAQEILEKYWSILIPRIAKHPALFSYCLFNEPRYRDYSDFSRARFHEWLSRKHGTVARLNELHGSNYTSFDEVPMPRDAADPALWYDWCRFNQDRFSDVHRWMIETIHNLDPHTPVHSKVQAMLFDTYHLFSEGIDHEALATQADISGNDNWSYYRTKAGDYAANWMRQAMYYDFQRSVAPQQPIFNSENHPIEDDEPYWVSGRHIRTMYWQGALHGQGATTTWVWERGEGPPLGNAIITRANCTEALGKVALDLLRLRDEVVTLQQIKPEIALLVVPASIPFSEDYLDEMRHAYEGLYFLGAPVGFVTDRQARNGGLSAFKAVFIPRAMRIEDDLVALLGDYVADGGTLVTVGDSFAMDEYSRPRDLPGFLPGNANHGQPGMASVGRGLVIYRPGSLSVEEYRQLGEMLMSDLGVDRPVRVTDEKGRLVPGVVYWSTRHNDGYLVNIVSYRTHEIPVRILVPEGIERMTNLFDGTTLPDFLELEPLQPLLLSVKVAK